MRDVTMLPEERGNLLTDRQVRAAAERVMTALLTVSSAQAELGRLFARAYGLRTTDAAAIVQIIEAERRGSPLTPAVLADRVALTSGAVSMLLARLEEAGHVSRSRESVDRRIVTLRSTTSIRDAFDTFYEPVARRIRHELHQLAASELEAAACAASRAARAMMPPDG